MSGSSAKPKTTPPTGRTSLLRAVIVDDSPEARLNLRTLLTRVRGVDLVGEATSVSQALALLKDVAADLLFLDIGLGVQTGFDLLKALPKRPRVIFTTVYREFGTEAFDAGADDYLVKPITEERLMRALNRVAPSRSAPDEEQVMVYRGGSDRCWLQINALSAVLGDGDYTIVIGGARRYPDYRRLLDWAELLKDHDFTQLDRSTLLQMRHVLAWRPHGQGAMLSLRTGSTLEIGRTALRRFKELFGE